MNAEQIIKDALDGWFFTLNAAQQVTKARKVAKDFIPSHLPRFIHDEETQPVRGKQWTEAEDALLKKLYDNGYSFKEMGKAVGVGPSAANYRWQELCLKWGIPTCTRQMNVKYPPELYAKVAHMKNVRRMTFGQISEELDMTRNQIAGIWKRWKQNNAVDEYAA